MFEYTIITSTVEFSEDRINVLKKSYSEMSILDDNYSEISEVFWGGHLLLLARHRFDYQGQPFHRMGNNFIALIGWLVNDKFKESSKNNFISQLYGRILGNKKQDWLIDSIGEYQIITGDEDSINIVTNIVQTHPVYYSNNSFGTCISNRASLANIINPYNNDYDVNANLELIAFDNILDNKTLYNNVSMLKRNCDLYLTRHHLCSPIVNKSSYPMEYYGSLNAVDAMEDLSSWLVNQLKLLPKQVKLDKENFFGLSGGKDSRLLLLLLKKSDLFDYYSGVTTHGYHASGEVLSAENIVKHYGLNHQVNEQTNMYLNPLNYYFDHVFDHIFQMEGEIGSRSLHGNHHLYRKTLLTGHEAGLRESLSASFEVSDFNSLYKYVDNEFPLDPFSIIKVSKIQQMRDTVKSILNESYQNGVATENLLNWYSIIGRGSRWVGKLTSMSSPRGLYANIFCSNRVTLTANALGIKNSVASEPSFKTSLVVSTYLLSSRIL